MLLKVQELHKEQVVSKQKRNVGIHNLGDFNDKKGAIKRFLKQHKGLKAYDINDNEIGYIEDKGHFKSKNSTLTYDETVLKKNGKIFAEEKNGKFLDLEGKALKDTLIKKGSGVYYLDIAPNVKYFDKEKEVETKKGKENLDKKPVKSALKSSREVAKKIGEELRKEQEKNFAGINKKPKAAALKKVETPKVPTR
ncbi:hypothetical protein [Rickettsia endosymbiont of Gonocerus acuteangulatus]|uniref:hypothetical protein n=1 Tax=Rickettsia endosymbiont of Gonocerus acuteangulatus TaxID=3066266 RepID=UPI00313303AE